MAMDQIDNNQNKSRRDVEVQLDRLDAMIAEVRILYEQYFTGILQQPPDKQRTDCVRMIKLLLKAPFKNSASRFRLRTLVHRFQTYNTYWERVNKQREEGTYTKDLFKAELREKQAKDIAELASEVGASERGMRQLFSTYEDALRKSGANAAQLNFDSFKKSMMRTAQELKKKGASKVHYKVVVKNGKVILKASTKS